MKCSATLIIMIFLAIQCFADGWEWQNPLPTGNQLNDVFFIGSKGWIAGKSGTVLFTPDSGLSWVNQSITTRRDFNCVFFADTLKGWTAGESGSVYITEDGGNSWVCLFSGEGFDWHGIYFCDSLEGWVAGNSGKIAKTTDGGQTWTVQYQGSGNFYALFFKDDVLGWAAGQGGVIVKTEDGGNVWSNQTSGVSNEITDIFFIDENDGWFCTADKFYSHTTDGGANWVMDSTDYQPLTSVYFSCHDTGWIAGGYSSAVIMRTVNGGLNWSVSYNYELKSPQSLFFLSNSTGIIAGKNGSIYRSTDSGISWDTMQEEKITVFGWPVGIRDVQFLDENNGWIAASDVFKTTDGGATWTISIDPGNDVYYTVFFTDTLHGCVAGEPGFPVRDWKAVRTTTDGGNTWTVTSPWNGGYDIFFTDYYNGWIAGNHIENTTDGGFNWTTQLESYTENFYGVYFVDEYNGWCVGSNNSLVYTTNGGQNWTYKLHGGSQVYNAVVFTDENNGWIAGNDGMLLWTNDGGSNWNSKDIGCIFDLNDIVFSGQDTGWIVGEQGIIYCTTDGGINWTQQISLTKNNLYSACFLNSQKGWATGEGTSVLHTTSGGFTGVEEITGGTNPEPVQVTRCFPNPFTGYTAIEFFLEKDSYLLISIYNAAGQRLADLADGSFQAGPQQVRWNGRDKDGCLLPGGLYFYLIQVENGSSIDTDSGRIILLK